MSIKLEQLKTERDQAKSKMMAAVREANEAAERYIVNRNAYDEWQAKKNASSAAMAEFGKANIAYLNAHAAQPLGTGSSFRLQARSCGPKNGNQSENATALAKLGEVYRATAPKLHC